ncbi:T9SS type A sorting domain-containing protein [Pedobacter sp. P351]|uniref:T9SS type A sorting domain-containing protein n=1 Tax=Pedobacter superstes TaxID=3133441 RepID=UPI003095F8E9
MKRFFFLVFIFSQCQAFGQGRILLKDDFKDNKNKWALKKNSDFLVEIKAGALHLEKFEKNRQRNGCLWYGKTIPQLNTLKNFSITLFARFVSGGDIIELIDLQWGARNKSVSGNITGGLYQLSFHRRGRVHLDYFHTKWSYFVRKDINPALLKDFDFTNLNKYEIIQNNGFVILKVNDQEVLKQFTKPIPGNTIGFQQCLKSAWEIDKIIVRQETSPVKPFALDSARMFASDPGNLKSPSLTTNAGFVVFPNPFDNSLSVGFQLDKEQTVIISLIDMKGSLVQQHTKTLLSGTHNIPIYADVPPGSYVVKTQLADGRVMSRTVIKQ